MVKLVLAASAMAPALLFLWFFVSRDRFPEPRRAILTAFGLGAVLVLPLLALATPASTWLDGLDLKTPLAHGLLDAFLCAAIPEEALKFLLLLYIRAKWREYDEPMDGLVYGAAAGLGFAALENLAYVIGGGFGVALARAISAVPSHAMTGAFMGAMIGLTLTPGARRGRLYAAALVVPTLLHGLYDFPLLTIVAMDERGAPPTPLAALGLLTLAATVLVIEAVLTLAVLARLRGLQPLAGPWPAAPAPSRTSAGPAPDRPSHPAAAWGSIVAGAFLAAVGGLVALALTAAFFLDETKPGEAEDMLLGLVLCGLAPLLAGAALLRRGLARLGPAPRREA